MNKKQKELEGKDGFCARCATHTTHTINLAEMNVLDDAHTYVQNEVICDCGETAENCKYKYKTRPID